MMYDTLSLASRTSTGKSVWSLQHETSGRAERTARLALVAVLALVWGCGKASGGGGNQQNQNNQNTNVSSCPEGTVEEGEACVPQWGVCSAPDEIPLLGGGCRAVGAERCETGSGCAAGFAGDSEGGCVPVLPPVSCPEGTIGLLGAEACAPIADCGAPPWGDVTAEPDAVYVDAAFSGGLSDGSPAAPFVTLAQGLAAAPAGGQVVVAAGTYAESLSISRRVTLSGRCPTLVAIEGTTHLGQGQPALLLSADASGSRIEGLRLTGPGHGAVLNQAVDVRFRAVEVLGPQGYGVLLQRGATAAMRRVKVEGARTAGVILFGGHLQAVDTVVTGTEASGDGAFGRGIDLECDHQAGSGCASLDATGLVVEGSREAGIFLSGGSLSLSASLVADTRPNAIHGMAGIGIQAQCDTTLAVCPRMTILGSVVARNHGVGILAQGAELTLSDSVVEDTQPQETDGRLGMGLLAQCEPSLVRCEPLTVTCSTFSGNHQAGLALVGVEAQGEGLLVVGTEAQESSQRTGDGIMAQCEPVSRRCADVVFTDVALRENTTSGLFVHGARVQLSRAFIAETRVVPADETGGYAVYAQCDNTAGSCARVDLDACLLVDHYSVGVTLFGGLVHMRRSAIHGVLPQVMEGGSRGLGLYADGRFAEVTMDVADCEIRDALHSGAFLIEAQGALRRSWIHGGELTVILDASDGYTLEENLLEGSVQSEPLVR